LHNAKIFAVSHHERWNGTGYPYGLAGEEIPLQGRIMAIADVYDALISKRIYKEPYTFDHALALILEESGKHFDPKIIDVFYDIRGCFFSSDTFVFHLNNQSALTYSTRSSLWKKYKTL